MRLIDADELEELFNAQIERGATDLLDAFDDALQDATTVDAVTVVRCRECQYWQDNNGGYPHPECRWGHGETPDENDFCSYGERKDDAT